MDYVRINKIDNGYTLSWWGELDAGHETRNIAPGNEHTLAFQTLDELIIRVKEVIS